MRHDWFTSGMSARILGLLLSAKMRFSAFLFFGDLHSTHYVKPQEPGVGLH